MGPDVIAAVNEFFLNGRLLKDLNNTTIALIPKLPRACKLGDFRPISCCNLIYKIISKIISNRLKGVLQDSISPSQSAFLKGRSLGENVLLSSELIRDYGKASCEKSSMLKVDIKKAFDTVSWDFVLKLLEAQNFPPIFRRWVSECISSPRFSVAINGELAGFFRGKKGLRQGDPLSPYLFLFVMEVLSNLLVIAANAGRIRLHPRCSDPKITHLLFADDLLIFSNGSRWSINGICSVMDKFKRMSGLSINPDKSHIFFGGYAGISAQVIADISGFSIGTFPTRYLGFPLNPSRITMATLQPFIDKIIGKLHSWTVKFLSFAGKIRLVASEIYGMVNFWSQVFVLPKAFYAKIDSLCAAFLWKNKTTTAAGSRVAWRDVCRPKAEGGVGIRLLEDFQLVFRLKLVWNLFSNSGSLWVAWLKKNVFGRKGFWLMQDSSRLSPTVRSMVQLKPMLNDFLRCQVRDGASCSFWYDTWTLLGPLISVLGDNGPRTMRIGKNATVSKAAREGSWLLPPARSPDAETVQIVLTTMAPPTSNNGADQYLWRKHDGSFGPTFSSKTTWEHIRQTSPTVYWAKVVWFKENIPRNAFISWLALLRRLPTRDRLRRWGMNVPQECVLCSTGIETHHHLFFECEYSSSIWKHFAQAILPATPLDVHSAAAMISHLRHPSQAPPVIKLIFQSAIYLIWKERNARVFTSASTSAAALRSALDRLIRDRLLSFPSPDPSPSLLQFYFSGPRPP